MKRVFLAICAAALMFGCFESNPVGGGETIPSSAIMLSEATYTLSGDSITTIGTSISCNGSTLVTTKDTSKIKVIATATKLYMTDNGSTTTDTLTRLGTGSGIQGSWSKISATGTGYIKVSATTVQMYMTKATLMTLMKGFFLGPLSNSVGITLDTSNAEVVKMTGKTTLEVVTLSINNSGQLIYSSSVAANAAKTVTLFNITTCPNDINAPTWFTPFLAGNVAAVPKLKALDLDVGTLNF